MLLNLKDLREEYHSKSLNLEEVAKLPRQQFELWFQQALEAKVVEPNAMILSTLSLKGRPVGRVVLLKEVNAEGFVFFTNYESRKGQELAHHPFASLVFNWLELHRQVRIEGSVERISPEASTAYFQSRPKGSQIGAWASPQSQVIPDREVLADKVKALEQTYAETEVLPRPPHWGGYLLRPDLVEFWQGQPSRLHDRIQYKKEEDSDNWVLERLAP